MNKLDENLVKEYIRNLRNDFESKLKNIVEHKNKEISNLQKQVSLLSKDIATLKEKTSKKPVRPGK